MYKNHPYYEDKMPENIRKMLEMHNYRIGEYTALEEIKKEKAVKKTYSELLFDINCLGTALSVLLKGRGHKIALLGQNSIPWVTVYMTVLSGADVIIPIDDTLPVDDIIDVLEQGEAEAVFYSKAYEEQMREYSQRSAGVKYFISLDKHDNDEQGCFFSYEGLKKKGKALLSVGDKSYIGLGGDTDGVKMILFYEGQGVMLSQKNLMNSVEYTLEGARVGKKMMCALPMYYVTGAIFGVLAPLWAGSVVCIGSNDARIMGEIRKFSPDSLLLTVKSAEEIYDGIWENAKRTNKAKKLGEYLSTSRSLRKLGINRTQVFFEYIKRSLGGKLEKLYCIGTPISSEISQFYHDIGIELIGTCSIPECSGVISFQEVGGIDGTGKLISCLEAKMDCDKKEKQGRICLRGDTVMMGYYKNDIATESVFDESGWYHTGLTGRLDSKKQLWITGQKRNTVTLGSGRTVGVSGLERRIEQIDIVRKARVYPIYNKHKSVICIGCAVVLNDGAAPCPKTACNLMEERIRELNRRLPQSSRISRVRIKK